MNFEEWNHLNNLLLKKLKKKYIYICIGDKGRLSPMQRFQGVDIYNDLHELRVLNKLKKTTQIANERQEKSKRNEFKKSQKEY